VDEYSRKQEIIYVYEKLSICKRTGVSLCYLSLYSRFAISQGFFTSASPIN
jgi:hypothetical protein